MKRKIISIITLLAMCMTILPGALWAEDTGIQAKDNVSAGKVVSIGGHDVYVPNGVATPATSVAVKNQRDGSDVTWQTGWYYVTGDVKIEQGAVVSGDVNLILADDAALTVDGGIQVTGDNALTIWGASENSTGQLLADCRSGWSNAGIGTRETDNDPVGAITINGGTVKALVYTDENKNTKTAAAIGGTKENSCGGSNSSLTVNHGTVEAQASLGAGIGGACNGGAAGMTVTINGGKVIASSGDSAAIGGSWDIAGNRVADNRGEAGTICINGGTVEANSVRGPGIGGGCKDEEKGPTGTVTINGGTVNAKSTHGAGIGGFPMTMDSKYGPLKQVTIQGGTVTATSTYGAGIGGGSGEKSGVPAGAGVNLEICNSIVTAASTYGAGIGGGGRGSDVPRVPGGNGGEVKIDNSTVTATSTHAVGIGGGNGPEGDGTSGTFAAPTRDTVIFANGSTEKLAIADQQNKQAWSGYIFENGKGHVYGTPAIKRNTTIPNKQALQVEAGKTLAIAAGATLTNEGSILVEGGMIDNQGTLDNTTGKLMDTNQKSDLTATFTIKNGALADGRTSCEEPIYKLAEQKSYAKTNSFDYTKPQLANEQIPTGMQPTTEFAKNQGDWDRAIDTTSRLTQSVAYTYTFNQYAVPSITVDVENECFKGFYPNGQYTINEKPVVLDQGCLKDIESYIGQDIRIVRVGDNGNKSSAAQAFKVARRTEMIGTPVGVKISQAGKQDGKITGLSADKVYQYKAVTDPAWTKVAENSTEITGLAAGTYEVRVAPLEEYRVFGSEPTTVIVEDAQSPVAPSKPDQTETTENPDGSTTTVVTKPDGTKTTTTEQPNGDKVSETKKPDGTTIEIEEKANGDKTTETKKPDGTQIIEKENAKGDKQKETKQPDGTKVTEKENAQGDTSKEVQQPDGSGIIDISKADGSQSTTTIDKNGKQETKAVVSDKAVEEAVKENKPLITPTPAKEAPKAEGAAPAPVLNIQVPKTVTEAQPLTIVVPVENIAPSDVLVLVHEDGTEEVVRKSIGTEDGIKMQITGDVQLKVVNNEQTFNDTKDHWAGDAIDNVTARGIFNGVGNDSFAPDVTTNRAMLVTVLHNLESNPEQTFDGDFNDVDDSAWYAESVKWAAETGIVSGVGDNNFAPEDTLTREQMVTMLYRYAGSPKVEGNATEQYSDSVNISDYAKDAMNWAISKGIINGVGNNTLDPQGQATRAQLAIVVTKLMQL